jgi:8-oxo-dGTP pyrophosphatase MutT (NUDIX family)
MSEDGKVQDLRIRMKFKPKRIFQMRIAGLAFRDGHVLVHRAVHEPFWTFPGGRAEVGETSPETLKREMMEELGVEVTVERLLWSVENFFRYEDQDVHEFGLYYLMTPLSTSRFMQVISCIGFRMGMNWSSSGRGRRSRL